MKISFTFSLLLLCYVSMIAQNAGDLDLSFGDGGSVITDLGIGYDQCAGLVVQPDQKIVVGGRGYVVDNWYPTLVRMNPDGTLDDTFSGDGIATSDVPHSTTFYAEADALALQPDGKLLYTFHIGIFGEGGLAVTRFNADGSIDTDFGINGTASHAVFEESNYSNSLLLQADGKILVAGLGQPFDDAPYTMAAVRFTAGGQLDETFAEEGVFTFTEGLGSQIRDVKQDANGRIVFTGHSAYSGYYDVVMIRLLEDGTFDDTFDEDGRSSFNISGLYDAPSFVTLRADGSMLIAVAAYSEDGTNYDMAIASMTAAGELDDAFGTNGFAVTVLGDGDDLAQSVLIAPDGKILVAGRHEDFYIYGAVLRYHSDGTPDNSFGTNGVALIDAYSYHVENIRLQADGKIVVCGWTGYDDTNEHHFTASRLLYDSANAVPEATVVPATMAVFPNPASDRLHIQWNHGASPEPMKILITDASGKIVWQSVNMSLSYSIQIDTSFLPEGVYALSLQGKQTSATTSFVVAR